MQKPQTRPPHLQLVPNLPPEEPQDSAPVPVPATTRPWALGALAVVALGLGSAYASWQDAPLATELQSAFPAVAEPPLAVDVFAHTREDPLSARRLADRDSAHVGDSYTFVVHNRTNVATRFMLFGVDEHNAFTWFYPDGDAAKAHTAMALSSSPMTTLPDGVAPKLAAGTFQVMGLFTDKASSEAEVETAYGHGGVDALRAELAAQVQVVRLSVEP